MWSTFSIWPCFEFLMQIFDVFRICEIWKNRSLYSPKHFCCTCLACCDFALHQKLCARVKKVLHYFSDFAYGTFFKLFRFLRETIKRPYWRPDEKPRWKCVLRFDQTPLRRQFKSFLNNLIYSIKTFYRLYALSWSIFASEVNEHCIRTDTFSDSLKNIQAS